MESSLTSLVDQISRQAESFDASQEDALAALERQADALRVQSGRLMQAGVHAGELAATLETLENERDLLIVRIAEKDKALEEIPALRGAVEERDGRIAGLEKLHDEIAARDAKIAELEPLRDEVAARDAKIAELEPLRDEVAARDAKIAELEPLRDEVAARDAKIAELEPLRDEVAARDAKIAELDGLAAALETAKQQAASLEAAAARTAELEQRLADQAEETVKNAAAMALLQTHLGEAEEARAKAELEKKMLLGQVEGLNMLATEAAELRTKVAQLEAELEAERNRMLRMKAQTAAAAPVPPPPPPPAAIPDLPPLSEEIQERPKVMPKGRNLEDFIAEVEKPLAKPTAPDTKIQPKRSRGGPRRQLGELLVEAGIITQSQLEEVVRIQAADPRRRLGVIIVDQGYATEEVIAATLASQLRTRFVERIERDMTADAMRMVPQQMAINHRCVPLFFENGTLTLAMANPLDLIAIEDVQHATGVFVQPVVATPGAIDAVINKYYIKTR